MGLSSTYRNCSLKLPVDNSRTEKTYIITHSKLQVHDLSPLLFRIVSFVKVTLCIGTSRRISSLSALMNSELFIFQDRKVKALKHSLFCQIRALTSTWRPWLKPHVWIRCSERLEPDAKILFHKMISPDAMNRLAFQWIYSFQQKLMKKKSWVAWLFKRRLLGILQRNKL